MYSRACMCSCMSTDSCYLYGVLIRRIRNGRILSSTAGHEKKENQYNVLNIFICITKACSCASGLCNTSKQSKSSDRTKLTEQGTERRGTDVASTIHEKTNMHLQQLQSCIEHKRFIGSTDSGSIDLANTVGHEKKRK